MPSVPAQGRVPGTPEGIPISLLIGDGTCRIAIKW
jgi:hypothetical protein